MGLFSRRKLPSNLSGFKPQELSSTPGVATISMPRLKKSYSATFLIGPMNNLKGDEIITWLGKELKHKGSWSPEEIIWSVSKSLDLNRVYFPDRELVPLDNYRLYQARLNEYPYAEVSNIIKAAKMSQRKGNSLEFIYYSRRNFLNDNWQEASAHTAIVKRMDEDGFIGATALGPRRFSWQRVESAALLEGDSLVGEKAIRFEFVRVEPSITTWDLSEVDDYFVHMNSRLVISLGEHRGKGVYSYVYPQEELHDVGFGNS